MSIFNIDSTVNFLKNLTCPLRSSVEGIVLWGREVVNSKKMIQDAHFGSSVQCNYCFVGPRVCKLSTLTQDVNFVHTMKVLFCEETRMCSFLTKATCPLHLFFEGTVLWG